MKRDTLLAQAGSCWDSRTGAVSAPIYQVATFSHPGLGETTGFEYSRTANPTRSILEKTMADLEGGARALAFSSGLAALDAIARLFRPGDRFLVSEDPYGGSMRLFDSFYTPMGIEVTYVNTADTEAVAKALENDSFKAVFVEVPTNPLLRVADVEALANLAHQHGALLCVDNTFLTPVYLRPLELGADIVFYSATKYLGGHNDVVAGVVVTRNSDLGDRIAYVQNAVGAILGPMDSWLLLRGLKTLSIRLERQAENALKVATYLKTNPHVTRVLYPGLPDDPGFERMAAQADGFGAMVSFEIDQATKVPDILRNVSVFIFAESLGGTESLITFPERQTHADIPPAERARMGISDRLLRLSIGLEDATDLIEDLAAVLK